MRRVVLAFIGMSSLVLGLDVPASAYAPSPSSGPAASASAAPGTTVCKITDSRLTEASGIVATSTGFAVINDSNVTPSRERIFLLDPTCKITSSVGYPTVARDPEDLASAKDGTLWSADIGDNSAISGGSGTRRSTIALWSLAPGAKEPVIHRLAYPDGTARDAEALLISGDGTPVIVTKQPVGEVYVPDGPLQSNNTTAVKLRRAGTFTPARTGTSNPLSFLGQGLVTGGAVSPDGTKAVVRTLSDAYEFDVTGGDVVKAITSGKYRLTPLPNEPQGEGISFTTDGKDYVTCSDQAGASEILRYTPTSAPVTRSTAGANVASPEAKEKSFMQSLTLQDITYFVAGIGVLGLILVVAGVLGIRRSRTKRRASPSGAGAVYGAGGSPSRPPYDEGGPAGYDDAGRFDAVGEPAPGPPGGGNVYGGRPQGPVPPRSGGQAPPRSGGQASVPPRSGGQASVPPRSGGQASVPPPPPPAGGRPQAPVSGGGTVYGAGGGPGAGGGRDDQFDQQPRGGGQVYGNGGADRGNTYGRDQFQAHPYGRR